MKLGACGDRCDVCPRYIATVANDADLFGRIMRIYVKTGLRGKGTPLDSLGVEAARRKTSAPTSPSGIASARKRLQTAAAVPDIHARR